MRNESELDRVSKENIALKIELTELKQKQKNDSIAFEESKKTFQKMKKDLKKAEEKCSNCRELNRRHNEVTKKIKDQKALDTRNGELKKRNEYLELQTKVQDGLVRSMKDELQKKSKLDYPSQSEITKQKKISADFLTLDMRMRLSEEVRKKFDSMETFVAHWEEDDKERKYEKKMLDFMDGSLYVGEVDDTGAPHGFGLRVCPSGTLYQGYHVKGLSDGYGRQIFDHPCGDPGTCTASHSGHYAGYFKDDQPHGHGHEIKDNGEEHEGMNKKGLKEGLGRYKYSNGDQYEGEFFDDFEDGFGVIKFKLPVGEASYMGTWEKGMRHGFGVHTDEINARWAQIWDKNDLREEFQIQNAVGTSMLATVKIPVRTLK